MLSPIWGITISTAIFHLLVESYEFLFAVSPARRIKHMASVIKTTLLTVAAAPRIPTGRSEAAMIFPRALELF
jgi:hypothetical protein